jgi:hypothetical protein
VARHLEREGLVEPRVQALNRHADASTRASAHRLEQGPGKLCPAAQPKQGSSSMRAAGVQRLLRSPHLFDGFRLESLAEQRLITSPMQPPVRRQDNVRVAGFGTAYSFPAATHCQKLDNRVRQRCGFAKVERHKTCCCTDAHRLSHHIRPVQLLTHTTRSPSTR